MFRTNSISSSCQVTLFPSEEKLPADELKEIMKKSEFNMIIEQEAHGMMFCEFPFCDATFWTGGRHHCRVCGISVCEEHQRPDVVLSTSALPVIRCKLENAATPILAASRHKLPEVIFIPRACLDCFENFQCDPEKEAEFIRNQCKKKFLDFRISKNSSFCKESATFA